MPATTIFGLLGCGLLCVSLISLAPRLSRLALGLRWAAVSVAGLLVFIPIGDLSISAYVRGVTGDLSMPTLVLAACAGFGRITGRSLLERREVNALLLIVAGAALFLYPFALGWTPFDPYALGYGSVAFVTALLAVALAAWHARLKLVVAVVLAGALAYLAGAYESRNLWDYLIDPLVSLYAFGALPSAVRALR